ncbi:NMD protein affecting ribosome stability and mRNA decay [Xanthomonas arboricola]|nr:NMD protein affecting ribosome stability and mRNA decay [Xanthomonas cannabis]
MLTPHVTGAGRVRPASDSAQGAVQVVIIRAMCAMCARLQQYVAFQRLQLNRAAPHRMVVSICR